ncbi:MULTISPECIES: class I adenylate-forming enzyme family protein [Micromonospora]|uniref:Acyl-CoA synthetase (AMP-forming)/AMP-acid ligase II n=1 Tax=Micromonospora yangpuensis TaxID=683228 RepID=A0A1C6UMY3_9ACTN|nr:AMP-binding protein [Micromonospora yangpuensis]GGM28007.1 fatty-acyl-CoA synthase [Micromonospora yangpuensis]SCL55283.1 Acyl-CoA synthetase (AMP-forming)/AMP-acid ligase II [Micromonospora yangpuensis]
MAGSNFTEHLRRQALRRADHQALVDGADRWTYAELDADVDRYAAALREAGVATGDLVGVLGRNTGRYVLELLALSRLGAVSVPLNWRLHAAEQAYVVEQAGITGLLYDDDFADEAAHVAGATGLRLLVANETRVVADARRLADLLAAQPAGVRVPDVERGPADLHRLLYTSGTTARPKGVMHTCGNLTANHLAQILELELTPADRILVSAPLFHVSGLEAPGLAVFVAGATMVLTPTFQPADIARIADAERITGMVLAAQILFGLLDLAEPPELATLRYLLFAGVAPSVRQQVKRRLPHVRLVDTFGMTELCNGVCYLDAAHEESKLGALGAPFPGVHIRIVDEDFQPVAPGVEGEIIVRGEKISPGYWRDDEANRRTRRDGWFRTGDVGRIDADGYLWFVDRRTDLIKSGGENVASAEVERVLAQHPDVAEVAVIGVPDPRWDEVPKAFVILREGATTTAEQLREHCRAALARYKVPRYVQLVATLPRNDSGKVLKKALREEPVVPR